MPHSVGLDPRGGTSLVLPVPGLRLGSWLDHPMFRSTRSFGTVSSLARRGPATALLSLFSWTQVYAGSRVRCSSGGSLSTPGMFRWPSWPCPPLEGTLTSAPGHIQCGEISPLVPRTRGSVCTWVNWVEIAPFGANSDRSLPFGGEIRFLNLRIELGVCITKMTSGMPLHSMSPWLD